MNKNTLLSLLLSSILIAIPTQSQAMAKRLLEEAKARQDAKEEQKKRSQAKQLAPKPKSAPKPAAVRPAPKPAAPNPVKPTTKPAQPAKPKREFSEQDKLRTREARAFISQSIGLLKINDLEGFINRLSEDKEPAFVDAINLRVINSRAQIKDYLTTQVQLDKVSQWRINIQEATMSDDGKTVWAKVIIEAKIDISGRKLVRQIATLFHLERPARDWKINLVVLPLQAFIQPSGN